jgi:hypothetical protein
MNKSVNYSKDMKLAYNPASVYTTGWVTKPKNNQYKIFSSHSLSFAAKSFLSKP